MVFYNRRYQFILRLMLGGMMALYFYFIPIPFYVLSGMGVVAVVAAYLTFHVAWWLYCRAVEVSAFAIRLAHWMDLLGASIAVSADPYPTPPSMVLILIAVLGNGFQHGLRHFKAVAVNGILASMVAIPLHFYFIGQFPPYDFYFFFIFLLICVHYAFNLASRMERVRRQAEKLAQRDELTGLLNRRALLVSARYLVSLYNRTHIPLVFVFADLDHFKQVNDTLGHEAGDRVLQTLGRLCRENFRRTDIAARYGGDEFVFILTGASLEEAKTKMASLRTVFLEWADSHQIPVGVSFGFMEAAGDGVTLEGMMRLADEAVYAEKKRKKAEPEV